MNGLSNKDIAWAIFLTLKDKSTHEQQTFLPKVVEFLYKKRLFPQTKDVLFRLKKIMNREDASLEVNLWSALRPTEDKKKEIANFLKKRHKVEKIIFNEKTEGKLLGGYKIEAEDEIIDMTIDNKIKKLQEYLTN